MNKEKRSFTNNLEIRSTGESKKLKGYAALFNERTEIMDFVEEIKPGAFDDVLESDDLDVRFLINHDPSTVLARYKADRSNNTLELKQDSKGLLFIAELPDIQEANDLIEKVKRGDIDQASFGFIVAENGENWTETKEGKTLREIENIRELFDTSIVTYPAYNSTNVEVASKTQRKAKSFINLELKKKEIELLKLGG